MRKNTRIIAEEIKVERERTTREKRVNITKN